MIKHFKRVAALAAVLTLPANVALAQSGPPWEWGWWFWWFPVFPLFFVLGCLAVFVFIMVHLMGRHAPWRDRGAGLDILNERLARGEIDKAEYEEKRRLIVSS
jgi:putative membrane protein